MSLRPLWWVGLLALTGLGCRDQGAVKLTVAFPGFKPACIRVAIQPEEGAAPARTLDLVEQLEGKTAGDLVTVAAYREAGWSSRVRVSATSFERADCSGEALETRDTTVSVAAGQAVEAALELRAQDGDGDGFAGAEGDVNGLDCDDTQKAVHPAQAELCNDRDDNCDGVKDEGLQVGAACREELGCDGKNACAPDGKVRCELARVPSTRYRDADEDGHGAGPGEESCGPVGKGTGYASVGDDCDDNQAKSYPGNTEVCDGVDNNCDQVEDKDVFALGTTCDDIGGCVGTKACAQDGSGSVVCADAKGGGATYFLDEDGDSYGTGAGILVCEAPEGYVSRGGDCNDGNAFTYPGATELCDGEDNNCTLGTTDEAPACATNNPTWTEERSAPTDVWRSVSRWDANGVWVAGGGKYDVRRPDQTSFANLTPCKTGLDLHVVWARPAGGDGSLGGMNEFLGRVTPAGGCTQAGDYAPGMHVQGLIGGFASGTKTLTHLGGIRQGAADKGRMAWTDEMSTPVTQDVDRPVLDVHGLAPNEGLLFAVGGHTPAQGSLGGEPRIYRHTTEAQPWVAETIQWGTTPVVKNVLRGVWVVSRRLAFAVGDAGSVLVWDGKTWTPFPSPGSNEDLLSVVSFGRQAIYVTTRSGKVLRYRDNAWKPMDDVPPAKALYDIAGKSPVDLWVVGEQGKRLHWK